MRLLQSQNGVEAFLKHPISAKEKLYHAYLEYLWLLERLRHPQEKAFFKSHYLPCNGYLEGFFDLSLERPDFFEAIYAPVGIDQTDWRKMPVAKDGNELEEILSPNFDFHQNFHSRRTAELAIDLEGLASGLLDELKAGTIADKIGPEQLLYEGEAVKISSSFRSLSLYPITGLAHVFLPETRHSIRLQSYWCEHFESLYLFELCEADILPFVKDLNALSYTNRLLGSHSKKRYQGLWQSTEFGTIRLEYENRKMSFKGLSKDQINVLFLRIKGILPSESLK